MMTLTPEGRLPLSRPLLIGCALLLGAPVVAHADDGPSSNESTRARIEMNATLARMASAARDAREMLRAARKHGSKREILCLDETLSRVDVARRSARDRAAESIAAYDRGDLETARASRARVAELDGVQRLAVREGSQCFPQPVQLTTTGTVVRVMVNPAIPHVL